ncbi:MAG: ABC transporter permease, partial [Albidovulum sp.]|nr:ABC transporter permease [Albidovulum sp.]
MLVLAVIGPYVAPFDPLAIDFRNRLAEPSLTHILGTDGSGRDVLSRILYGAKLTILSTVTVIATVLLFGCILGIFSAFVGG